MLQPIIIFSIVCVGCFVYYKFMLQKTNTVVADFDKEGARNNIESHTVDLVNSQLPYLKEWMKGSSVDSFTDASIAISLKGKAKNAAIDAAKSVAWRAVGVRAKYQRVDTTAHLVLSNDELHFVEANIDGDLETHITFTKDQLNNAKMEYKGAKKSADLAGGISDFMNEKLNSEDAQLNVYLLTFKVDGKQIEIQAHDKLILQYTLGGKDNIKNGLIANLIAENFFKTLGEKYPNLKARKMKMVS